MYDEVIQKPKKRWQDLLHKKCPNCSERLKDSKLYLQCPSPHPTDPTKSCFFIKKETAASFLLDPEHPANYCLTPHERESIEEKLQENGFAITQ